MNRATMMTGTMQTDSAQVIAISSHREVSPGLLPFADNNEHLQALEYEASLMVASAALRTASGKNENDANPSVRFPFLPAETDIHQALALLDVISAENRAREALSRQAGIILNFVEFSEAWALDNVERSIVMLLLMQFSSPSFFAVYEASRLERNCDSGMEIGAILSIISRHLGEQLQNRRYFSIHGTLLSSELLHTNLGFIDSTTSILRMSVYLHERVVRHMLGDENQYHLAFRFIRQERSSVSLDQVVLPDDIKRDIILHSERYMAGRMDGSLERMDKHFGYGTGMAFLFHGPSGTGKTMLAKGLANHLDCPLVSLNMEDMPNIPASDDEILAMLFREAALLGGIVFLDECDDMFGTRNINRSRALLLEIEKSRCITILATNKPLELDPAMDRRLAMKVRFEFPSIDLRLRMWQALLPPSIALAPDIDLASFAERYHFTGGVIKNCILTAAMADNGRKSLTKESLEHAATLQEESMNDLSRICEKIEPDITLDKIPLGRLQREQLQGVVKAWDWLRVEETGFNLLVNCSDIQTGITAMCGLAAEAGMTVHAFNMSKLTSIAEADKVLDMVSQRRITPMEAAFQAATARRSMTLLIDHSGEAALMFEALREKKVTTVYDELYCNLRRNRGLVCLLTGDVNAGTIPVEFHQMITLAYPPEELQMRQWEENLGSAAISDDDLVDLAESYPMHLAEIDFISRQAKVRAIIAGRMRVSITDVTDVISGYRGSKGRGVLFGGRGL